MEGATDLLDASSDESLINDMDISLKEKDPDESDFSDDGDDAEDCRSTSEEGGKQRSKYKHVPHREKPPQVVARRNARERRRVQNVNSAFMKLRKHIPYENRHKRLSKVKTLRTAIDYIRHLNTMVAEHDSLFSTLVSTVPAAGTQPILQASSVSQLQCLPAQHINGPEISSAPICAPSLCASIDQTSSGLAQQPPGGGFLHGDLLHILSSAMTMGTGHSQMDFANQDATVTFLDNNCVRTTNMDSGSLSGKLKDDHQYLDSQTHWINVINMPSEQIMTSE